MAGRSPISIEERIELEAESFSGQIAIYADNFQGDKVEINPDLVWPTASCIKVPILIELYRRVAFGEVDLGESLTYEESDYTPGSGILKDLSPGLTLTLKDLATLMVIISDNTASNMLIDYLGKDAINNTSWDLGLKNTTLFRKIDFTARDDKGLGITTAREYASLFRMIYSGQVWDANTSRQMLAILKGQHYQAMLTRHLPQNLLAGDNSGRCPAITVASKNGSISNARNDGGIFFTPWGDYILVILTRGFSDKYYHDLHESYEYGGKISRLLFDYYWSASELSMKRNNSE